MHYNLFDQHKFIEHLELAIRYIKMHKLNTISCIYNEWYEKVMIKVSIALYCISTLLNNIDISYIWVTPVYMQ